MSYDPRPDPDDLSYSAWWSWMELRYDVMPTRLWDHEVQQREYELWKAERAQLLNAKRVLSLIGQVMDKEPVDG